MFTSKRRMPQCPFLMMSDTDLTHGYRKKVMCRGCLQHRKVYEQKGQATTGELAMLTLAWPQKSLSFFLSFSPQNDF